jgi:hypothetical protein
MGMFLTRRIDTASQEHPHCMSPDYSDLNTASSVSLASPNSMRVFSLKKSGFCLQLGIHERYVGRA